MKLWGRVPNFYIHVSVSDLYIPMIGPPILLQTHECTNLEQSRAVSFLGIIVSNFRYSVFAVHGHVFAGNVYLPT